MQIEARFRCAEGHEEVFYNSWACPVCEMKDNARDIFLEQLEHAGISSIAKLRLVVPIGTGQ